MTTNVTKHKVSIIGTMANGASHQVDDMIEVLSCSNEGKTIILAIKSKAENGLITVPPHLLKQLMADLTK